MSTYIVNTGDRSITDLRNSVIVDFEDDDFDEDSILDYAQDHGVAVGPKVDAVKFDAALEELVAAVQSFASESFPDRVHYHRVEDAKVAVRAAAGLA